MTLQINLYNPVFIPKREWLAPKPLAIVTLASLLAVTGGAGGLRYAETVRGKQLAAAQSAQKQAQDILDTTRRATAQRAPSAELTAELNLLKKRLGQGEVVLGFLQGGGSVRSGFADYLTGFARQSINGLWLTRLSMGAGGAGMVVQGRAVDQALIASYVSRLQAEKAFSGLSFADLRIGFQGEAPAAPPEARPTPLGTAVPVPVPAPAPATAGPGSFHVFELTAVRAPAAEPASPAPPIAAAPGAKS